MPAAAAPTVAAAPAAAPAAEPILAKPSPYGVELEPGKDYYWCSCGRSKSQPFCDGSHKGTGIAPVKFKVQEKKTYWLCGCKVADKKPFCDGTHNKEKGVRKYNEFLIKSNTELRGKLDDLHWKSNLSHGITVALGVVLIGFMAYHHTKK